MEEAPVPQSKRKAKRARRTEKAKPKVSPLVVVVAIIAFFGGSFAVRTLFKPKSSMPALTAGLAEGQWVANSLGEPAVTFDAPWTLSSQNLQLPALVEASVVTSETLMQEADGAVLIAMFVEYVEGTDADLTGAADGAINNMRTTPGILSVNGSQRETTVLGGPARAIESHIKGAGNQNMHMRGLVFGAGTNMWQIMLMAPEGDEAGGKVWDKLVASIR